MRLGGSARDLAQGNAPDEGALSDLGERGRQCDLAQGVETQPLTAHPLSLVPRGCGVPACRTGGDPPGGRRQCRIPGLHPSAVEQRRKPAIPRLIPSFQRNPVLRRELLLVSMNICMRGRVAGQVLSGHAFSPGGVVVRKPPRLLNSAQHARRIDHELVQEDHLKVEDKNQKKAG